MFGVIIVAKEIGFQNSLREGCSTGLFAVG